MSNGVQELELRLLLACSSPVVSDAAKGAIRSILEQRIDWTVFARLAVGHEIAGLAAYQLCRIAPELLPADVLDALGTILDQSARQNRAQFEELRGLLTALAAEGVEALTLRGPVLALRAYADPGARACRNLEFLVPERQLAATIATLRGLGYAQREQLTGTQLEDIDAVQSQAMLNEATGTVIELHMSLPGRGLAIDVDSLALWQRTRRMELHGRSLLVLAPEDEFIALAVHGSADLWRKMKWACDIAAFISTYPKLEWATLLERASEQGCLRMVLVATALARQYFDIQLPPSVVAAELALPSVGALVGRIVGAVWHLEEGASSPASKSSWRDRLILHDGPRRRARYLTRGLLTKADYVKTGGLPRQLEMISGRKQSGSERIARPLRRLYNRLIEGLEHWQSALSGSQLALAWLPASSEARAAIRQHGRVRADAERQVGSDPNDVGAWCRLGDALVGLQRHKKAIACYDKALELAPYNTVIWKQRTNALRAVGAQANVLDAAPPEAPDPKAWAIHAGRLLSINRFAEAIEASDRALALDPEDVAAVRVGIRARLFACDWRRREQDKQQISQGLGTGKRFVDPFFHRVISGSEAEHLEVARLWMRGRSQAGESLWCGELYRHNRLRIGYMSTDFRDHVVSEMIAGCLEQHDRGRLELTAVSLGPDDGSAMRSRISAAFDRVIDGRAMSDAQVASCIRQQQIDVLIDLNGSSGENRPGILLRRPAPVQATYLGYPGTTALPCLDYIIADRIVIPEQQRRYYTEQVVDLPYSFMPNDSKRPIAPKAPSRLEAGLPEVGFVFACHNHEHKLSPEIFDVWMRLLSAVEGSVIWLKSFNPAAVINLRREARARGIAPERLIFAPRVRRPADHLARLQVADLFLDTLPYNAHATACDALWAGLPVLTCLGSSFAGRVAASLLHAVGLPELVTSSPAEYEALALALAQDPQRLAVLRATLWRNRRSLPLFDTLRLTRHLEAAYESMWARHEAGLPPASFSVGG